jgi:hypothetical protein
MNLLIKAILGCTCIAGLAAYAPVAGAADHQDAPGTKADPMGDINDVYAFNDHAGANSVFAMTLFPAENLAPSTALFSDAIQYVFHTASTDAFGEADAAAYVPMDIICTFTGTTAPQTFQCWAGATHYATGAVGATGVASADGNMQVYVGAVADPFFFNLDGFHVAQATVQGAVSASEVAINGTCPTLDNGTAALLREQLTTNPADGGVGLDYFASFDALAIVVSLKKSLVNAGGPITSVWGATYVAP